MFCHVWFLISDDIGYNNNDCFDYAHMHSVEEAVAVIERLPKDVVAIYRIPPPTLDSRNNLLSRAAIARRFPLVSCLPLDEAELMTFTSDLLNAGRNTARLAHLIPEVNDQ